MELHDKGEPGKEKEGGDPGRRKSEKPGDGFTIAPELWSIVLSGVSGSVRGLHPVGLEIKDGGAKWHAIGAVAHVDAIENARDPIAFLKQFIAPFAPALDGLVFSEPGPVESVLEGGVGEAAPHFLAGRFEEVRRTLAEHLPAGNLTVRVKVVQPLDALQKSVDHGAVAAGTMALTGKETAPGQITGSRSGRNVAARMYTGFRVGRSMRLIPGRFGRLPALMSLEPFRVRGVPGGFVEGEGMGLADLHGGRVVMRDGFVQKTDEVAPCAPDGESRGNEIVGVPGPGEANVEFAELFVGGFGLLFLPVAVEDRVGIGDDAAWNIKDPLRIARITITMDRDVSAVPARDGEGVSIETGQEDRVEGQALGLVDGHDLHCCAGGNSPHSVVLSKAEKLVRTTIARLVEDTGGEGQFGDPVRSESVEDDPGTFETPGPVLQGVFVTAAVQGLQNFGR